MKKPFVIVAAVSAALLLTMLALLLLDYIHTEVQPRTAAQPFDAASAVGDFDAAQNSGIASSAKYIRKIFSIPAGELPPEPKSSCFGTTDDPAVIQALIEKSSRLLDGQETFWNPDIELMPGEDIHYYCDESILVIAWKEAVDGLGCSFVEIRLADGSQLRRKLCRDGIGNSFELQSMTATEMAAEDHAVAAVDGDFYVRRWRGIIVRDGEYVSYAPSSVHSCLFTAGGDLLFLRGSDIRSEDEVKSFILDNDVKFAVNFGPVLVENGELQDISPNYIYGEVSDVYSRCAIGQRGELHYLLMTVCNEQDERYRSCTAYQEAQLMYDKGVERAYALDGGHTTTITMGGSAFNRPDYGIEKQISDIICFASADRTEY